MKAKNKPNQEKAAQLVELLGLDVKHADALELISRWEQEPMTDYCRRSIVARMNSSLDDLQVFATSNVVRSSRQERAWARQFYGKVARLMNRTERRAA